MAKFNFTKGTTSQTVPVFIQDSSSTTGAGLPGLTAASSGLTAYHYREAAGTGGTAIALTAIGALGTWESGGFFEIDATNMPGWYELGLPNAALATGADFVGVQLKGAANMAPVNLEIQLTGTNVNDAVRGGMTALPNAAANAAGGLPISIAGGLDLDSQLAETKEITAARMTALSDWLNGGRLDLLLDAILDDTGTSGVVVAPGSKSGYTLAATTGLGNQSGSVGSVTGAVGSISGVTFPPNFAALGISAGGAISNVAANADMRGTDGANVVVPPTVAEFNARTLASASYATAATQTTIDGKLDTLLGRITAALFTGITSLAQWLGLLAGKQIGNVTALAEIKATGGGAGTYDPTTDSTEAIRDRGDAAWITGGAGGGGLAFSDTVPSPGDNETVGRAFRLVLDNVDVPISTRAEAVSAGSGAFVVTITVDDGTSPLENVTVRLREGANNFTAVTNASGVATFALDAATYTISATKVGYQFTPTTIVVTAAADFPQSMTAITVSASAPGFSTGALTCFDENGVAEAAVAVSCSIKRGPGTAGLAYDSTVRTETSGGDGVVQFTNLVIGATYLFWRADRDGRITVTIPNAASFDIPEVVGKP